jgi:hypothetical protein
MKVVAGMIERHHDHDEASQEINRTHAISRHVSNVEIRD